MLALDGTLAARLFEFAGSHDVARAVIIRVLGSAILEDDVGIVKRRIGRYRMNR
jgi:hypothetical protein